LASWSTVSGEGYSLPQEKALRTKWVQAVKHYRNKWDGPSTSLVLCSKHFEPECFISDGVHYSDVMGIPAKKRLKPDAIPMIFDRPTHGTPGKIFHLLSHMWVACISNRTFYYHQSQYLHPAVLSVWKNKQHNLMIQCRSQGTSLIFRW